MHDHPSGNLKYPQAVAQAGMSGSRINQIGRSQLLYTVQFLKRLEVDQLEKWLRKEDILPDRIPHRLIIVMAKMF